MSRNEQQSGSDTANVIAALSLCCVIVVIGLGGMIAYERRPDKDPDKRPVEERMEEFYGMPFTVLNENWLGSDCTIWELRSSDGIECSVVQCRESYGGVTTVRCYDTYGAARCEQSDAMQTLLAMDAVEITLNDRLKNGGMGRDLPAYEWRVNLQNGTNQAAIYTLIDEAVAAAEMTADDIYRTEYWRTLPPTFVLIGECGEKTRITLTVEAEV